MTLIEALKLANSGALLMRASDKHAKDWPWRVTAPVNIAELEAPLAALRNVQMFTVPGLERRTPDFSRPGKSKWQPAVLMWHQAKADDWEVFTE
jgi:hypothetical protein